MAIKVSIIICTQDRARSLAETLESLGLAQVPAEYAVELIVVDNASRDETKRVVEQATLGNGIGKHYLFESRRGKSRAQNLALRHASGEVLVFTDDDVRFPVDWLRTMCEPIIRGEADAVQGGIRWASHLFHECGESPFLYSVIASTGHKSDEEMRTAMIGANMALSRKVYQHLGDFDEELGPGALGFGEETLYGWQLLQLGYRKVNRLEPEIEHHFDGSRLDRARLIQIAERHGRSEAYVEHHWQHLEEPRLTLRITLLQFKNWLRTVLTPAAWPSQRLVPPWKFSYHAILARLLYLQQLAGTERRYEKLGLRRPGPGTPTFVSSPSSSPDREPATTTAR